VEHRTTSVSQTLFQLRDMIEADITSQLSNSLTSSTIFLSKPAALLLTPSWQSHSTLSY